MFSSKDDAENKYGNGNGKCLIIDDEIAVNPDSRTRFYTQLPLPKNYIIFAATLQNALEIMQEERKISTVFLDSKIPMDNYSAFDYSESNHGIELIPKINEFYKYTSIYVYSAYVAESYLREQTESYRNIVGYLGKLIEEEDAGQLFIAGNHRYQQQLYQTYNYIKPTDTDLETLIFLDEETTKLNLLLKKTAEDIVKIGNCLNRVKQRLDYGLFNSWVKQEFAMSDRTANRMMKVANTFSMETVSNLNISPTILYELSKDSTPEPVIQKVLDKAKQGEKISGTKVQIIKENYELENQKTQLPSHLDENIEEKLLSEPDHIQEESDLPVLTSELQTRLNPTSEQKQQIVGVVRRQDTWELGKHLLFCGDPNSDRFIKLLPRTIALNLAFPLDRSWLFSGIARASSHVNFFTEYRSELEPILLGTNIETYIKLTTDLNDAVSICFLPDPIILQKADELGCICFIAEPDRAKCELLVELWKNT